MEKCQENVLGKETIFKYIYIYICCCCFFAAARTSLVVQFPVTGIPFASNNLRDNLQCHAPPLCGAGHGLKDGELRFGHLSFESRRKRRLLSQQGWATLTLQHLHAVVAERREYRIRSLFLRFLWKVYISKVGFFFSFVSSFSLPHPPSINSKDKILNFKGGMEKGARFLAPFKKPFF